MKAFIYHFDASSNPVWYAGLGVPFKMTTDFSFAKSVDFGSVGTSMLLKQLEKFYGKNFYQVSLQDAVPSPDYRCASCSTCWTEDEKKATIDPEIHVHLASPLRTKSAPSFAAKINNARKCLSCRVLLCGDCAPNINARSKKCVVCKPKRRRG
ncbi:MAG: hypothetical protein ACPGYS_04300 [Flavobacteriales bacterium]